MKVIERHEEGRYKGRPKVVELTELEQLVSELYNIQLDQGHGCLEAMIVLRGAEIPPGLQSDTPVLNRVLTPELVDWLTGP